MKKGQITLAVLNDLFDKLKPLCQQPINGKYMLEITNPKWIKYAKDHGVFPKNGIYDEEEVKIAFKNAKIEDLIDFPQE